MAKDFSRPPGRRLPALLGAAALLLSACRHPSVRPDILLITVDTLRSDHLGCYGYGWDTSPFIDGLAARGVLFRTVITPLPLTCPSHATILTSLHPVSHGLGGNGQALGESNETLAEALHRVGYYTIGVVAAKHLSVHYQFQQGFDAFSDTWDPENIDFDHVAGGFPKELERVAKSVHASAVVEIDRYLARRRKGQPLFLWIHYYDPHLPYVDRPQIVLKSRKGESPGTAYDKEIRYTDDYIARLFRFLQRRGLDERLVTCITADHGEQLGDHQGWGHPDFYSETTLIPLILQGPDLPKRKRINSPVSAMDVAVTLLKIAGASFSRPVDGLPLLDDRGIRTGVPRRDFLILGDPMTVKSLQLIRYPCSFISNFDFFFRYGYLDGAGKYLDWDFSAVPPAWISLQSFPRTKRREVRVSFPHAVRPGRNYLALQFSFDGSAGITLGYRLGTRCWSEGVELDRGPGGTATVFFPVTPFERLIAYLNLGGNSRVNRLRYGFVPQERLSPQASGLKRFENRRIYSRLLTPRKRTPGDEAYDLKADRRMNRNLFPAAAGSAGSGDWTARIYRLLRQYLQEAQDRRVDVSRTRPLTRQEKEMLKSLGYL